MSTFTEKELEKHLKMYIPDQDPDPNFVKDLENKLVMMERRRSITRKWSRYVSLIGGFAAIFLLMVWIISSHGQQWVANHLTALNDHERTALKTNGNLKGESEFHGVYAGDSEPKTIQEKMLNAIDNYENIKGKFHIVHKELELDNMVEFEISEGDKPGSYVVVKGTDGRILTEYRSDGKSFLFMDHLERKYQWEPVSNPGPIPEGPRYFVDEKGQHIWITRPDPARAYSAHDVTFPQDYAFWLTDPSNYKITGHEKYLGRDVAVIEGQNQPYMAKKHDAPYFKMWVDTETGVLLKLIATDKNNQVSNSIEVLSLAIDQGVDRTKFSTKAPEDWREMTGPISTGNNRVITQ
ncbi:MAG: hypothetical protein H0Z33_05075 [Bacillaceae bacterium]|nr:hypothetical protein [Bacillaceae bacterium]